MSRTHTLITSILFFFCYPIFAGNESEIIYRTSNEFMLTEFSRINSGKVAPSTIHAVTRREFNARYNDSSTSSKDGFRTYFEAEVTPHLTAFSSPYSYDTYYPYSMMYLYEKLPKIAGFKAAVSIDDYFYGKFVYNVSSSKTGFSDEGIYHPLSIDSYAAGDSPDEGYISFSRDHMSITMGRFKGGSGNGLMGNLFQNSLAPYYDQISFTFYNEFIKYYYMLGSSSYKLSDEEYYAQKSELETSSDNSKMFAFHKLEVSLFEKVTIGAGAMALVGGKNPDFNMINPFGFYHDIYEDTYHSYYFSPEISYVPAKGHLLFVEGVLNEIEVAGENNPDPTATGFQIGYWYLLPLRSETKHRLALEATHVDTWTYSDIVPYLTMYQRQTRREITYNVPLGYSYGGDCEQLSFVYTAVSPSGLRIDLTLSRLHIGEINFELNEEEEMPYENASSYHWGPSGTIEKWSTVEIDSSIPLNGKLSLEALIHGSYIENFDHEEGCTEHLGLISLGTKYIF